MVNGWYRARYLGVVAALGAAILGIVDWRDEQSVPVAATCAVIVVFSLSLFAYGTTKAPRD